MGAMLVMLLAMLVGGAGIALGIVAHDRSHGRHGHAAQCSADE